MRTMHYLVQNIQQYPQYSFGLEKYLGDIETVYPIIEEMFGRKCQFCPVIIILNNSGNWSYLGGGKANIDITDLIIQEAFPRNLWGCLIHESLHAFLETIIYRNGGANELDNDCYDKYGKEVFVLIFQTLFYRKLKERSILSNSFLMEFVERIKKEVGYGIDDCRILYDYYLRLFSKDSSYFANFIRLLDSSATPMIRKSSFWKDLRNLLSRMEVD